MKLVSLAVASLSILGACSSEAAGPRPLRVSFLPDANPDELREKGDVFSAWLSAEIGIPVEVVPVTNYAAGVSAIVSGDQDLTWLGGVTTVQAMQQSEGKVQPLITRKSDLEFKSYFIVGEGVEASSVQDLKGKSFTFGSINSTSGCVMPQHFMQSEFGIANPEEFFASVAYSGAHDKTAEQVASGVVDAGALNYKTYDSMIADGRIDPKKARILWTTPNYVDYSWAVRGDVDERHEAGITDKIRTAFLSLNPSKPEHEAILALQSCKEYVAADPAWWDGIKAVLEARDPN
jgi:phosphonate transport system substrate-binding protein